MRRSLVSLVPLVVLACSPDARTPSAAPANASPSAIDAGAAIASPAATSSAKAPVYDANASVAPAVPLASKWGTIPPANAELYIAVDGLCRGMELHPTENAVFFSDGIEVQAGAGSISNTTFGRLRPDGFDPIAIDPSIVAIEKVAGREPDALFMTTWQGQRVRSSGRLYQLKGGTHWELRLSDQMSKDDDEREFDLPERWRGGFLVKETFDLDYPADSENESGGYIEAYRLRALDLPAGTGFSTIELVPGKEATGGLDFRALATGELFVVAQDGKKIVLTSYLANETAPRTQTMALTADQARARLVGDSLATLRLVVDRGRSEDDYAFDGSKWTKAPTDDAGAPSRADRVEMHGQPGNRWKIEAGTLAHDTGAGFAPVKLPPPVFSAAPDAAQATLELRGNAFGPDGEVLVWATYPEKGIGWKQPLDHWVVYRSKRPTETLRCNEPDAMDAEGSAGSGLTSWPPTATADCKRPFAVLTRGPRDAVATKAKKPDDHRALLAALRSHPEFSALTVVEFHAGDRTYAGVAVPSLDIGTNVIRAVAKKIPIHGELVCGEPDAVKTFPVTPPAKAAGR